jgi:hypothetical protein
MPSRKRKPKAPPRVVWVLIDRDGALRLASPRRSLASIRALIVWDRRRDATFPRFRIHRYVLAPPAKPKPRKRKRARR